MANKAKALTHDQAAVMVNILKTVNNQPVREPRTKAAIAADVGITGTEMTKLSGIMERRSWILRRPGPEKGVYYKVGAKGKSAVKAWDLLYS